MLICVLYPPKCSPQCFSHELTWTCLVLSIQPQPLAWQLICCPSSGPLFYILPILQLHHHSHHRQLNGDHMQTSNLHNCLIYERIWETVLPYVSLQPQ